MRWFLVVVLMTPGVDVDQILTIEMPNEDTCEIVRDYYMHAAAFDYAFVDPQEAKIPLTVEERRCVGRKV